MTTGRRPASRWAAGLTAGWAGGLLCIAALAAPAAFAVLPKLDAGRVVGRLFAQEANVSLALSLLLLGTLFCTVAGYFAVQPMMAAVRAGDGVWSFGALHAVSAAFYALKTVLVIVLAWRLSRV